MKLNKVLMKIVVDVRLTLDKLQGYSEKTLELSKFAVKLHKSIQKFEGQDFTLALSLFPQFSGKVGLINSPFERRM
jgi:hypothetical protein